MAVHRKYDILAIILLVLLVLAYASFRSEFRLQAAMPLEFFDGSRVPAQIRRSEEGIARAYWNCAVTQIQWRYGYAHRLPEEPPAEFVANVRDASAPAVRLRYWQKLQDVWTVSVVWHREYEWNRISLNESFQSAGQWMERHMRRIIGE
jgi:hypothetical protein